MATITPTVNYRDSSLFLAKNSPLERIHPWVLEDVWMVEVRGINWCLVRDKDKSIVKKTTPKNYIEVEWDWK